MKLRRMPVDAESAERHGYVDMHRVGPFRDTMYMFLLLLTPLTRSFKRRRKLWLHKPWNTLSHYTLSKTFPWPNGTYNMCLLADQVWIPTYGSVSKIQPIPQALSYGRFSSCEKPGGGNLGLASHTPWSPINGVLQQEQAVGFGSKLLGLGGWRFVGADIVLFRMNRVSRPSST